MKITTVIGTITQVLERCSSAQITIHPDNALAVAQDIKIEVASGLLPAIKPGLSVRMAIAVDTIGGGMNDWQRIGVMRFLDGATETATGLIGALTEDEVACLVATGDAAAEAVQAPKDSASPTVPTEQDLVDAARVADLAALKARARCAEMVLTASTPDAVETLARAAQTLGLRS